MNHFGVALKDAGNGIHDAYLDGNGNLAIVRNAEAVAQHVKQRLQTFSGEWFLDTTVGVTWLSNILGKNYNPDLAESVVKAEILNTSGVTEITSFSVKFDRVTRCVSHHGIIINTTYDEDISI